MISPDFVAPLNAGVLRFDRARETWRTLVPPHLPAPDQSGSGGNYLTRLTRDPREPDALYLVSQEWMLRWKERENGSVVSGRGGAKP